MLIDWFTVAAQTLNFLVLVWLLKRYLYQPILDAIDARESHIAKQLADADARRADAAREGEQFRRNNEELQQQRAALLQRAGDEARAERKRLLDEAQQAADALRAKRQESLHREQQGLNEEIGRRTQAEVLAIARKMLGDLADTTLEARMGEVFVRRLHGLDDAAKSALAAPSEPLLVRSAFALPAPQRAAIEQAIKELGAAEASVRFELAPDLISGIELRANGRKLAWNIDDYLGTLQAGVAQLLQQGDGQPAAPTPPTPPAPAGAAGADAAASAPPAAPPGTPG